MEILGLAPITITMIICIVGTVLRVYVGKLKSPETKFNVNTAFLSFMVALLISVSVVAPVINAISDDANDMVILPLIAGQIIIVMKSESISTAAQKIIHKKVDTIN